MNLLNLEQSDWQPNLSIKDKKIANELAECRVGTKPGVNHGLGHGVGHGVGHGLLVVNFPKNQKKLTKWK